MHRGANGHANRNLGAGVSVYLLWRRYQGTGPHRGSEAAQPGAEGGERSPGVVYDGEAWRPYLQNIHPCWLLVYRVASLLFFTTFTVIIVKSCGHTIFYYYTEWTFLLVTLYFGVSTTINCVNLRRSPHRILQLSTTINCVDFVRQLQNSVQSNPLLAVNSIHLPLQHFPWFRIAYFCVWTCAYVIFEWIVHASWLYSFLDLSSKFAPLWYVVAGVMQIPCYLVFGLVIKKLKKHLKQSPSAPVRATA
ncbi:uncharacterized protein [Aegilops tauschii subsp. strangulata]|uniref:uncharacterized protein n=1 Tax=Aegilops tauschii subsp. strangulata TaxID=200361 RepID=UPI003CC89EA7